jgi:hypothetical protein
MSTGMAVVGIGIVSGEGCGTSQIGLSKFKWMPNL